MEHDSFGRYISVIYRHLQILLNNRLSDYGISSGQYIFLSAVSKNQGISQKDLTHLVKVDKATTAKALKNLEQNGFLYRMQDADDKRYHKLYLTDKGFAFMPILQDVLANLTAVLNEGMDQEEYTQTLKSLKFILNNVQRSVEKLKSED